MSDYRINVRFHDNVPAEKKAAEYYKRDHTHTSKKGAELNAKMLAKGLKKAGVDLTK